MQSTETTLRPWTRPRHYIGATWEGYFIAPVTRNRDSGLAEQSNWNAQWEALKPLRADVPGEDTYSPQIVSENHFLCGWVEWVAIHPSNGAAVAVAEALAERLESCPILDEDALCRAEAETYDQAWKDYGHRDFVRALGLSDAASDLLLEHSEPCAELYEAAIPSGDFYRPEGDGVSLRIQQAADQVDRDAIARLLRRLRAR